MRARLPSHAENRLAENRLAELLALDRELTREERCELALRRKHVREQAARRDRYARDPSFRQSEIERNTRYWREQRA